MNIFDKQVTKILENPAKFGISNTSEFLCWYFGYTYYNENQETVMFDRWCQNKFKVRELTLANMHKVVVDYTGNDLNNFKCLYSKFRREFILEPTKTQKLINHYYNYLEDLRKLYNDFGDEDYEGRSLSEVIREVENLIVKLEEEQKNDPRLQSDKQEE